MEPKTPSALRGERGMAWLYEVGDEKKFVESCPTEKLEVMGVKIRDAVESVFISDDNGEIVIEDDMGGEDKAITICKLLQYFAESENAKANTDLSDSATVLGGSILQLHEYPEVMKAAGDALAVLLDKECVPATQVLTNLSLIAVYLAGTPQVTLRDVTRLKTIRRFLCQIGWRDPRAAEFLNQVKLLINPKFLQIEGSADVMITLFSQSAFITKTLHKTMMVKTLRACRYRETARLSYISCMVKVWQGLDGLNGAVFEQEVMKEYVTLAVNADTKHFHQVREALVKFRELSAVGYNGKCKEGLKRLMKESDVLSNLDVPNAVLRSNGICLLGDHFPIGDTTGKAAVEKMLIEQLQLLFRALHDPVSIVRANAVVSICKVLKTHWNELPKSTALPCLDAIFSKMSFDKADHAVRLSALKSIRSELLTAPLMQEIIKKLIGTLKHLDDPNARVRQAYTQILLDLSENPTFPVSEVINDEALIRRLSVEKKKFVMENLIKLVKNNLWTFIDPSNPTTEELKTAVKKLLVVATKYASAAVNIYRHLARQPKFKPQLFITLVRGVLQWVSGATTVKDIKQIEHILAVVSAITLEIRTKIIGKVRHMKTLASHIETSALNVIENQYNSSIVKQLLTQIRAVVSICIGDSPNAEGERKSLMNLLKDTPTDRLLISKCISAGLTSEMLAYCNENIAKGSDSVFLATEMLHNEQASQTILSDARWSTLCDSVAENVKLLVGRMRADVASFTDSDIKNTGAQIELLGRLSLHGACKREEESNKATKALKRQKKTADVSTVDTAQPKTDEDLKAITKLMTDTLLPTANKIKSKSALLAVTIAEQVLVFITQGINCGLLVKRLAVTAESALINGPVIVNTLLSIDSHLMPCVLVLVSRSLEMHISHLMFNNWMDMIMSLFRTIISQIDELSVVPKDTPFADAEDLRTRVWGHFADHGLHIKHIDSFASAIVRCNPPEVVRDITETLWCHTLTVGGYSVAPYLVAEFCKHKPFNNVFLDLLTNSLSRKSAAGNVIDSLETSSISMIFSSLLACKNRLLTARIASYYSEQLLPFFKKHNQISGLSQRDTDLGTELETDLFPDYEQSKCRMVQLGDDLATLDWTVPIPVASQRMTSAKSQDKKQEKITNRIEAKRKFGEEFAVKLDQHDSSMDIDAVIGAVAAKDTSKITAGADSVKQQDENEDQFSDEDQPPSLAGATPCASAKKRSQKPEPKKKPKKSEPTKRTKKSPTKKTVKEVTKQNTKKDDPAPKSKSRKTKVAKVAKDDPTQTKLEKKPKATQEEVTATEKKATKTRKNVHKEENNESKPSKRSERRVKPAVECEELIENPPPKLNLKQLISEESDDDFDLPVVSRKASQTPGAKTPTSAQQKSVISQSVRSKNELFLESELGFSETPKASDPSDAISQIKAASASAKSKNNLLISTLFDDDDEDDDEDESQAGDNEMMELLRSLASRVKRKQEA